MNGDPGFCLAAWSDQFSSWVSVAVFRERARIEHLAGRVALLGCPVSIVSVASVDDEDAEEAAVAKLRPPFGALVVHPKGDPNS